MNDTPTGKYGFAMKLMIALAIGSGALLGLHFAFGFLKPRIAALMAVGIGFWLLMFFGYRADAKERQGN